MALRHGHQEIASHRATLRHGPVENCFSQSHSAAQLDSAPPRKLPLTKLLCGMALWHGSEKKLPLTSKVLVMMMLAMLMMLMMLMKRLLLMLMMMIMMMKVMTVDGCWCWLLRVADGC